MDIENVIFTNKKLRKKSTHIRQLLELLILAGLLFCGLWFEQIYVFAFFFICITYFVQEVNTLSRYNGWSINEDGIRLFQQWMYWSNNWDDVPFTAIKRISYADGMPGTMIIETNYQNYEVQVKYNIYRFADTLKYFNRLKIPIYFHQRHSEIELYMEDRIDKLPED